MGTLGAALAWAARGFPVFPLHEGGKEPVFSDWTKQATTDAEVIKAIWTDPLTKQERNYNIGCACNDRVVVDVDVKNGKDGVNEYLKLQGHFDTLVVRTPTGGYHCYFEGPDSSNAPVASGVDIRSHNGYVVATGSYLEGVGRYELINDLTPRWLPDSIVRLLKPVYVREAEYVSSESIDLPASIEAARRYLESAPPAIEGQRGDDTTFVTAARLVREMALSVDTAFVLMRDVWNPRCSPPWQDDELYLKVQNAAAYGTAGQGRLTPEVLFATVNVAPPPSVFQQVPDGWGNAILPDRIPARPWLVERLLMRQAVTILMAAGSAGKSSVSLAIAAHLALGLPFAGYDTKGGPVRTIVYNGEDDLYEQSRRLLAVCLAYGFEYNEVKRNIMLLSPRELRLDLVLNDGRKPYRNDVIVQQLTEHASSNNVGLIILDPLVKIHKCDESDNVQMDYVMETLTDIAHEANVAMLVLHHTSKANTKQEERIGNMDISRGASAIVNAARMCFTLLGATNQDAEDYGLNDSERNLWVRLDDAKMNLALASTSATWFRKEAVRIPSLDVIGVMKYEKLEKSHHHIRVRIGRLLISTMMANGQASLAMPQVVSIIKANEPLWSNRTDTEIRRRVEGMYATAVEIEGKTLQVRREFGDKKEDKATIILS